MKNNERAENGHGRNVPPQKRSVYIYFSQKAMPESEAERFLAYYECRAWKNSQGNMVKNWKTLACDWIWIKSLGVKKYQNERV